MPVCHGCNRSSPQVTAFALGFIGQWSPAGREPALTTFRVLPKLAAGWRFFDRGCERPPAPDWEIDSHSALSETSHNKWGISLLSSKREDSDADVQTANYFVQLCL